MTDIKLFALDAGSATEIPGSATSLEKSLQRLIEQNFETMLGIDENASPVIIEYQHRGICHSIC